MNECKLLRVLILILIILLTIEIGSKLIFAPPEVAALGKIRYEYKIIKFDIRTRDDIPKWEKLLNKMGSEGWIYDHSVADVKVFTRKF